MDPSAATKDPGLAVGPLIEETIRIVRAHPLQLLGPMVILGILSNAGNNRGNMDMQPMTDPLVYLPFYAVLGLVALVVIILLTLAYVLATLVTTRAALDTLATSREPDLGAAYRGVLGGYWGSLGTFLLWFLAVVVGFILLVVPGFIVLAGFFPVAAIVVSEGTHGTAGLRRAWDLTKGHKWTIFLVILVFGLVSIVGGLLVGWIPIIGGALSGIISGAVSAALLVASVIWYRRRTAGTAAMVATMGTPPAAAPPAW